MQNFQIFLQRKPFSRVDEAMLIWNSFARKFAIKGKIRVQRCNSTEVEMESLLWCCNAQLEIHSFAKYVQGKLWLERCKREQHVNLKLEYIIKEDCIQNRTIRIMLVINISHIVSNTHRYVYACMQLSFSGQNCYKSKRLILCSDHSTKQSHINCWKTLCSVPVLKSQAERYNHLPD